MEEIEFPDGTVISVEEAKELTYVTPDGTELSGQEALDLYKGQFNEFVENGLLKKLVTNTTETKSPLTNIEMATSYVTPDGTELSGQEASDLYKGQFNEFVENGLLKKKNRANLSKILRSLLRQQVRHWVLLLKTTPLPRLH